MKFNGINYRAKCIDGSDNPTITHSNFFRTPNDVMANEIREDMVKSGDKWTRHEKAFKEIQRRYRGDK